MVTDFNAGDEIIDVRDIIARVEELREEKQDLIDAAEFDEEKDGTQEHADALAALDAWPTSEECEELETLESLLSDLCGYGGDEQWEGDWYPVTLIHENYFETSMDEMLEDCEMIPKFDKLPSFVTITIDYDALKQDYSEVEFEGETYYYR